MAIAKLLDAFTEHPQSVGETYLKHMGAALSFSRSLFVASGAALVHGVLPFLCAKTASSRVTRLHERMMVNRVRPRSTRAIR